MDVARPWEGISIHAPLAGYDHLLGGSLATALIFQSTHPSRSATALVSVLVLPCAISIHAPLAGCDTASPPGCRQSKDFNPRTPRGVRRTDRLGVTSACNFNPRTPRGVRPGHDAAAEDRPHISIHAPLAGCDLLGGINRVIDAAFQSTHPSRGATGMILFDELLATISIHAPLAGCDYKGYIVTFSLMDFNPRTPRGVRQQYRRSNKGVRYFNPRTPRGVRLSVTLLSSFLSYFNPRTPRGVRPDTQR